jgi:hypothetical protein
MKYMEPQQPTYQIVTVYEALENMDKLEGHGIYKTVAYTLDEELARKIAHGDGVIPGKTARRTGIILDDGLCFLLALSVPIRIETDVEGAMRSVALAKLTPEERHALGLE